MNMEPAKITEYIMQLTKDVAEIKQKLDTDYSRIAFVDNSVRDHETRLSRLETERSTNLRNLMGFVQYFLTLATLAVSIFAILKH